MQLGRGVRVGDESRVRVVSKSKVRVANTG